MYHAERRLGFAFDGDFSPSIQNYAFEIKYSKNSFRYIGVGVNTWIRKEEWDALYGYILYGLSFPFERVRPYIEGGLGGGGVEMSKDVHTGVYFYGKGGLELRVSPYVSIDGFCKFQSISYDEEKANGEKVDDSISALSGGISIVFWKLF